MGCGQNRRKKHTRKWNYIQRRIHRQVDEYEQSTDDSFGLESNNPTVTNSLGVDVMSPIDPDPLRLNPDSEVQTCERVRSCVSSHAPLDPSVALVLCRAPGNQSTCFGVDTVNSSTTSPQQQVHVVNGENLCGDPLSSSDLSIVGESRLGVDSLSWSVDETVTAFDGSEKESIGQTASSDVDDSRGNNYIFDCDEAPAMQPIGRRIVHVDHMWNEIGTMNRGHKCPFSDLKIVSSHDRGLRTKLNVRCIRCEFENHIWTDPTDGPLMGINKSAVLSTLTAGTGHATLQESLASVGIRGMTKGTYRKYRDELYPSVLEACNETTGKAGRLEAQIAVEKGNTVNGIPFIAVIADGAWAKRSFAGGKHDSLSGVGIIFGQETGLALFVGVRNKYCSVCATAERLDKEPSHHACYKNWNCNQSSTSMEKHIIAEGFRVSLEQHGLIYKTLISDGDSSVYKTILDANPYAMHGIIPEKIECNNHLFRNMCKKIRIASEKKISRAVYPQLSVKVASLRQRILSSALRIRKFVERARDARKAENIPAAEKNKKFQCDIVAALGHVFGDHSRCQTLPFTCEPDEEILNLIHDLQITDIYSDIYKAVSDLSCHARSLLEKVSNNVAESCNSLINKCNIGKRTNQCARSAYEMRCYTAVLQYNTQKALSTIHEISGNTIPLSVIEMERSRSLHVSYNKAYRQRSGTPKRRKFVGPDKDYGPTAEKPDVPPEVYNVLVENQTRKLKAHQLDRDKIERATVTQGDNERWHSLRTEMLTASNFGTICRMRPTTSCAGMVRTIRRRSEIDSVALRYGIANETTARAALQVTLGKTIMPCGLFIDRELEYLGASPDGLIDDDATVEIKCPYSARDTSLAAALEQHQNLRRIFHKKGLTEMNESHGYYYQVQGQLRVTGRKYCIFALWTSVDLMYIKVYRNDIFWQNKMEPALSRFYYECLLPEIVDSRMSRGMPIRDPAFVTNARDELLFSKKCNIGNNRPEKDLSKAKRFKPAQKDSIPDVIESQSPGQSECQRNSWNAVDDNCDYKLEKGREILEVVRHNISVEEVIDNTSPLESLLNDSSIDLFLKIVTENSEMQNFNPASYTVYPRYIVACEVGKPDMQIIGGGESMHWCCLYYNGEELLIYDSLCRCDYIFLHEEEKQYIRRRYGHVDCEKIFFMPVTKQPDGYSCGVYSAAFATTLALGDDPVNVAYSRNPAAMRAHLVKIIQERKLLPFPTE